MENEERNSISWHFVLVIVDEERERQEENKRSITLYYPPPTPIHLPTYLCDECVVVCRRLMDKEGTRES